MKHTIKPQLFVKVVLLLLVMIAAGMVILHLSSKAKPNQTAGNGSSVSGSQTASHQDTELQHMIDTWAAAQPFHATVVATELTGSLRTASRSPETAMVTASTYKIYVAYAVLHQVEEGKLTLATSTRTGQTVEQALDKMILESDNDSAEALGFLVGWDTIDTLAAGVGATHTDINNYDSSGNPVNGDKLSTAGDLALMVAKLQQNKLLNPTNTQKLLGLMKNQVWRERIPAGVPTGIAVADKPGWLSDVENDAAVVYGPISTYVLVIMTNGSTTQPLANLSKLVYNYLET